MTINDVVTVQEIAIATGKDVSSIRRRLNSNKYFKVGIDCKKSHNIWLITKDAVNRVYNIDIDTLLNKIK